MAGFFEKLFGGGGGDELASKGAAAYVDGRNAEAVDLLQRALKLRLETHARDKILTILGNAFCDLDEYERSIESHEQALKLNPKNHQAWVNLGIAHRRKGSADEAAKCYEKAVELNPDYAEAHASVGALYIFMNRAQDAVEALEHAKKLDPSAPVTHGNLALALGMLGRFEEAEAVLKHAVALGYANWRSVRSRLEELRAIEAEFDGGEEEREERESAPAPRWSADPEDEGEPPQVCPNCGKQVSVSLLGTARQCPACGGELSRFSSN